MAYREEPLAEGDLKRELLLDMLGDLVVGGLTKLYRRLYDEALVNPEFSGDFIAVRGACTVPLPARATPRARSWTFYRRRSSGCAARALTPRSLCL